MIQCARIGRAWSRFIARINGLEQLTGSEQSE